MKIRREAAREKAGQNKQRREKTENLEEQDQENIASAKPPCFRFSLFLPTGSFKGI